ncbi:hypothetical protein [Nocardia fluminea]|uniref:hypothetical protein n=1 Tax=Nocardia fluminea TaxID=134984 RepID=UPI003D0F3B17
MARRSSGTPGELLEFGTSLVKSSPELSQLTDTVRGELLGAVRSAAVTAASNRIDALNNRLQQGSTLVADEDREESGETESDEYDDEPGLDDEQASAEDDEEIEGEEQAGRPAPRARARRSGTAAARKATTRSADRKSGVADRKPPASARRRSRADADEAPVRRTRR